MPTLQNGYIRHKYKGEYATWQVDEGAESCLHEFGFKLGKWFPTDIFMLLWEEGLIWTDSSPGRSESQKPIPLPSKEELAEEKRLEEAIRDFYAAKNTGARRKRHQAGNGRFGCFF